MRIAPAVVALAGLTFVSAGTLGAKPSPAVDWTRTVVKTSAGGYRMGNPKAKVQLVEYGSMTCPHCRAFDDEGTAKLIGTYVKSGKVSFEFRNYIRDPYDLAAAVIARCNGAKSFFALTRGLFRDQTKWVQKIRSAPAERRERLATLEPDSLAFEAAKLAGFPQWAAARGLPAAKTTVCLRKAKEVNGLVAMTEAANSQYPDFSGTPSFVLNGKLLGQTATWEVLEPQLRSALGQGG